MTNRYRTVFRAVAGQWCARLLGKQGPLRYPGSIPGVSVAVMTDADESERIDDWALNGEFDVDDCYYCDWCRMQWMTPHQVQYCPGCGESKD